MNSFGRNFRVSIFGESHGIELGVVIDGLPAGLPLSEADLMVDIERRKSGARGTTPRKESDMPHIVSGLFNEHTTGAPLAILFRNENTISNDYRNLVTHPRPSHSDWVAGQKFHGWNDYRGGGHFSGRLTVGLVAAGAVARKVLAGVEITSRILEIGGCTDPAGFADVVEAALRAHDSVGGIIECRADGVSVGWGEPFFDSVESYISHAIFSVPAVRGIEFGTGFQAARMRGSSHNDPIVDATGRTATNHAGGVVGGISNGNPVVFRVAIKPTASIAALQQTFNTEHGAVEELRIRGRHDACIALRAPVVIEAATAIALADLKLTASTR